MRLELLDKLCCPEDKQDLNVRIFARHENGEILEALLTCDRCKRYYPVIYGIPIMTPDEYRDKALEEPLLKRWGYQLDSDHPDRFLLAEGSKPVGRKEKLTEEDGSL